MEVLLWILTVLLFIGGFIGLIYPIIPAILLIVLGFIVYEIGIGDIANTYIFWSIQILLILFVFLADFITNKYFLGKAGSSKKGQLVGTISLIVGSFIIPPIGLIILPFVSVFIFEFITSKDISRSAKLAVVTVLSFVSSTFAKAIIQITMIIIFLIFINI
ncbi:MAG: putative rane protein [Bacillales bacterium]|jgi:uncharacterized protein YqgC (DUF456 family)|nr:putative rane protein [Bacillales bacterium]